MVLVSTHQWSCTVSSLFCCLQTFSERLRDGLLKNGARQILLLCAGFPLLHFQLLPCLPSASLPFCLSLGHLRSFSPTACKSIFLKLPKTLRSAFHPFWGDHSLWLSHSRDVFQKLEDFWSVRAVHKKTREVLKAPSKSLSVWHFSRVASPASYKGCLWMPACPWICFFPWARDGGLEADKARLNPCLQMWKANAFRNWFSEHSCI